MKPLHKTVFTCLAAWLAFSSCAQATEFLRLCQASLAKAEAFLAECRANARPFKRDFFPGGHGPPVPEEHSAWFDTANGDSHFGLGCALGPKDEIRFIGMYFALKPSNFRVANAARFTFIDFSGNVGMRSTEGERFTLLAVHKFTPPGHERGAWDRNCEIGHFDPLSNQTVERRGAWFTLYMVTADDLPTITKCVVRDLSHYEKKDCFTLKYRSLLNNTQSAIIYDASAIKITEEARLFVTNELFEKLCGSDAFAALEYINFIKELCAASR
jgi:hypothetical protein